MAKQQGMRVFFNHPLRGTGMFAGHSPTDGLLLSQDGPWMVVQVSFGKPHRRHEVVRVPLTSISFGVPVELELEVPEPRTSDDAQRDPSVGTGTDTQGTTEAAKDTATPGETPGQSVSGTESVRKRPGKAGRRPPGKKSR